MERSADRGLAMSAVALREQIAQTVRQGITPSGDQESLECQALLAEVQAFLDEFDATKLSILEARFRALFDATSDVVFCMSADWREMRYLEGREFVADTSKPCRTWLEKYIPPEDHASVAEAINQAIAKKAVFELEHRVIRVDGTLGWAYSRAIPIMNPQGELVEWCGAAADITLRRESRAKIRMNEERLRAVLETASDAIITIDYQGKILTANPAAYSMFGYHSGELHGKNVKVLMPQPYAEEHDQYVQRYLATRKASIIGVGRELVGRRKDGSQFPIALVVSEVDDLQMFTGIIRDISARKELQKAVLEIAAEEDRRIGMELHDNVLQQLTGLGLLASAMAKSLQQHQVELASQAEMLAQGIKQVGKDITELARGLIPVDVSPEGLLIALERLANRIEDQYQIHCGFACDGTECVPDAFAATHLYRIASEAVTNALKHGRASQIDITLRCRSKAASLKIRDNGIGIASDSGAKEDGVGLKIMHYRAGLIGAVLKVSQCHPCGTEVSCTLPKQKGYANACEK